MRIFSGKTAFLQATPPISAGISEFSTFRLQFCPEFRVFFRRDRLLSAAKPVLARRANHPRMLIAGHLVLPAEPGLVRLARGVKSALPGSMRPAKAA